MTRFLHRRRPEWIEDSSLRQRLSEAVATSVRGKHSFQRRMNEAMGYFAPIQEKDFPPELRAHARAVLGVRDIYRQQDVMGVWFTYSDMRPKDRDAWMNEKP